ncbi:MAG TPA: hypothetical protein VGF56_02960 [Rhizomicrobium sp.]|jgi:ElaB/YqjD/DUF883 family membrane-anchored ribosome-binding protein
MAARAKTDTSDEDLKAQLDALVADLRTLQADVGKLAQGAKSEAGERVTEALKQAEIRLTAAVAQAQTAATQAYGQAEEWATDNIDSLRDTVREQPIVSVAVAAGIGALFGLLFLRR